MYTHTCTHTHRDCRGDSDGHGVELHTCVHTHVYTHIHTDYGRRLRAANDVELHTHVYTHTDTQEQALWSSVLSTGGLTALLGAPSPCAVREALLFES